MDIEPKDRLTDPRNVLLCKRTNDPKLAWLEETFRREGIRVRRDGESYHAPLLWVHPDEEDAALAILTPIDDIPDDDPRWANPYRRWHRASNP